MLSSLSSCGTYAVQNARAVQIHTRAGGRGCGAGAGAGAVVITHGSVGRGIEGRGGAGGRVSFSCSSSATAASVSRGRRIYSRSSSSLSSISSVDGLDLELLEMNEAKISRLLATEKLTAAEVDDMLEMPPGSAARRVRIIRIEALLDELGTELTQAVAHNAGAGATMLQTIQETIECRRSDVEASTEAALAARESLDADVAAFASAAAALDAQETRVQNRHIADVAALRGMHGTKLKRVDEAFRAAAEDVATNTALIRAKYTAEERQLVDDLPRRLRPVQDEQGALQRRRDDLNGRAVKVRDEEVFVAALVKDLSFHEEHTRGEASALMTADEALRTIRTEVVDLRDHAKEMPGEDLNNVVSYAKALNVASMRVTPVEYEQKITTKLFVVKSFLSKITTKINKGPQDQNKKEVGSSRGDGGSRIGNGERTEDLDSFEKRLYADAASWSPGKAPNALNPKSSTIGPSALILYSISYMMNLVKTYAPTPSTHDSNL